MLVIVYYALMFIIALYFIGHIVANLERKDDFRNLAATNGRRYIVLCSAYAILCSFTVVVGVSKNGMVDRVSLFFCEFLRMVILVLGAELVALLTEKVTFKRKTIYVVSSELLYLSIAGITIRTLFSNAEIIKGPWGESFALGGTVGTIAYVIVNIIIIFIYASYTYMFYFSMTKKREKHIFIKYLTIVIILILSFAIEMYFLLIHDTYVPSMNLCFLVCLHIFYQMIEYERKIEYNINDYREILSESNSLPAFICDDEGTIIFENVRASVMKQMYKESDYIGRHLSDLFDISDYDKERLKDPRVRQVFDVYCKYSKEPNDVLLKIKHNIDIYGEVFSTEIQYIVLEENNIVEELENTKGKNNYNSKENRIEIIYEDLNKIRYSALIDLLKKQRELYDKDERVLFEMNLIGILKLAELMSISTLVDLCERIHESLVYSDEWQELEPMIINLDRQYETLKIIYGN